MLKKQALKSIYVPSLCFPASWQYLQPEGKNKKEEGGFVTSEITFFPPSKTVKTTRYFFSCSMHPEETPIDTYRGDR